MPEREVRPRLAPAGVYTPVTPIHHAKNRRKLSIHPISLPITGSSHRPKRMLLAAARRDNHTTTYGGLLSHSIAQHSTGPCSTRIDRSRRVSSARFAGFETVSEDAIFHLQPQPYTTTTTTTPPPHHPAPLPPYHPPAPAPHHTM